MIQVTQSKTLRYAEGCAGRETVLGLTNFRPSTSNLQNSELRPIRVLGLEKLLFCRGHELLDHERTGVPAPNQGEIPPQLRFNQSAPDALPGRVLKGKVNSLSPASGAQFALLPPDNATGNFTKLSNAVKGGET